MVADTPPGRPPLPEDVRRFILTSIPSVPFLEALLVFKAARDEAVATQVVAQRLYITAERAGALVADLRAAGIVRATDVAGSAHRYSPTTPERADLLDRLARCYASNLIEVTDLIHSRTERRAQQFADAFKLRKD
jgi:hypothetical protein